MCEFCRESWSEEMTVFSFTCEFISEESMALCSGPAGYQIKERYVEDHLCEQHVQTEALSLADGLMGNMHLIRLSEGETLNEITEPTACYRCGNPAKYARITMTTTYLCKRHRGFRAVGAGPVENEGLAAE
jgi:hypothetical protein